MVEKKENSQGRFRFATINEDGLLEVRESGERPLLGGYLSEKKYGSPKYCPSATRWHKKAQEKTGSMPNLVWFDSVEAAVASGFSPCGNCWTKGENAEERWEEYLSACEKFAIEPIQPPKAIQKLRG